MAIWKIPPLVGLLAYISSLLGGGIFWIKFWPALFGTLTLLVTLLMVKEYGGNLFAQSIAALGILFSAYLRINFLFQPNFLDIFFWSLSAFYILRFINTQSNKYIFLLAFLLASGWYSKYSVLFFIVALVPALLLTYHRTIFLRKQFWLAILMACVFILPNIIWQYYHNWPLVHHMKELQETQLQHINRLDFIKEQLLMLFPELLIWVGGLIWLLRNKKYRVIAWCFLLIIFLLMIGSGKGYYSSGAYPMLLAAGGVWAERLSINKRWLRPAFVFLILLLALLFVPILLPFQKPETMARFNEQYNIEKIGLLKWEDGKNHPLQQDFADMLGGKELTVKTENFINRLPDSVKSSTIIYCRNYGLAGGLKFYGKNDAFRNKVISDNGTFLLWIPDQLYFKNMFPVGKNMPDKNDEVFQHFEKVQVIDSCVNTLSKQFGYKIIFFQNASDSASIIAQKGLQQMKQTFSR